MAKNLQKCDLSQSARQAGLGYKALATLIVGGNDGWMREQTDPFYVLSLINNSWSHPVIGINA